MRADEHPDTLAHTYTQVCSFTHTVTCAHHTPVHTPHTPHTSTHIHTCTQHTLAHLVSE